MGSGIGATDVFLAYVRPHWRRMHQVARQYARREDDAHDLVQETLLRAWRGYSPSEGRAYKRGWLFVIMRNVALEWRRTARSRIRLVLSVESELTEVASAEPGESLAALPPMSEEQFREFLDDRIAGALDALEGPFREVVFLSVAGGLSYREIAEVLDCPVGTVMSRMGRARRMLRERLAQFAGVPRGSREVRQ